MNQLDSDLNTLQLWRGVKENLQKKYTKIESAFKAIDVNESGAIEVDDFEKELQNYHQIDDKEYFLLDFLRSQGK